LLRATERKPDASLVEYGNFIPPHLPVVPNLVAAEGGKQ